MHVCPLSLSLSLSLSVRMYVRCSKVIVWTCTSVGDTLLAQRAVEWIATRREFKIQVSTTLLAGESKLKENEIKFARDFKI